MPSHPTALAARCAAVNRACALLNEYAPKVREALAPFADKGLPIYTADNTLRANVRKALPTLPNGRSERAWLENSEYSISLHVQANAEHDGRSYYGETSLILYFMRDNALVPSGEAPPPPLRTDWTPGEVQTLRAQLDKAKRAARELQSQLYFFGEYDR